MKKIVLITGANKGIGFETARLLGEAGMTVLVGARTADLGQQAEAKLREKNIDAHFVHIDVTDDHSIAEAARLIEARFGLLDILVNNAGITGGEANTAPSQTTREGMRGVFETNVFSVVAVTNAMLPLLRKSPSARIVNVSSEVGSLSALADPQGMMGHLSELVYAASKTALNMVTVQFAKELRDAGIKVNSAIPGYCATDLNGFSGFQTAEQGARVSVELATLPDDGPTGTYFGATTAAQGGHAVSPW